MEKGPFKDGNYFHLNDFRYAAVLPALIFYWAPVCAETNISNSGASSLTLGYSGIFLAFKLDISLAFKFGSV